MIMGDKPQLTQVEEMSSEPPPVDQTSSQCLERKGSTTVNNGREVKDKGSDIKRKKGIISISGRTIKKKEKDNKISEKEKVNSRERKYRSSSSSVSDNSHSEDQSSSSDLP